MKNILIGFTVLILYFKKIKGTVKNIPPTMMTDQFGMLGFLSAYRGMQVNPTLATLAIGQDPVNMGLGMNNQ